MDAPKVTKYDPSTIDNPDRARELVKIIADQESSLRFNRFDYDVAWKVGTTIREGFLESKFAQEGAGVVIAVELFNDHSLFRCTVGIAPAVGPDNWLWVRGKLAVVRRFGISSLRKGRELASKSKKPEQAGLVFPEYACHGGAFPIWIKGVETGPIGAICVSGLPQLHDHQLIVDSLHKCDEFISK